jgi:hypothetical protein
MDTVALQFLYEDVATCRLEDIYRVSGVLNASSTRANHDILQVLVTEAPDKFQS